MNELIKINKDQSGRSLVSARGLHEFLEITTRFSTWFPRMLDYGFVENEDFTRLHKNVQGQEALEYGITIDMAKELSMIQRSEKGKQARKYFIECERKLKSTQISIPQTLSEALMLAANLAKENEDQKLALAEAGPKVDYFDKVANTDSTFDLSEVAKNLKLPYGRNILFKILRERGVLMKDNAPYQRYVDVKYFEVIQSEYQTKDGKVHIVLQTRVTDKGMKWLAKNLT